MMQKLIALIAWLAIAAGEASAEIRHIGGATGQTLYARVQTAASTYFAVALTEGTSGGLRNYVATDAEILTAAGGTLAANPAGYVYTIRSGTASTTADHPVVNGGRLPWSGTAELVPPANATLIESADPTDTIDARALAQLVALNLDHLMAVAVTNSDVVNNSALAKLASKAATAAWSSFNNQTDALEALADGLGGFTATQRAQILAALSIGEDIGVPKALIWTIKRADGDMTASAPIVIDAGEEDIEVAADFRGVLAVGDAIQSIDSIALINDAGSETTTSDAFGDVSQAEIWMNSAVRFAINAGAAGDTDRIRVKARTVAGRLVSAPCTVIVKGAPQ